MSLVFALLVLEERRKMTYIRATFLSTSKFNLRLGDAYCLAEIDVLVLMKKKRIVVYYFSIYFLDRELQQPQEEHVRWSSLPRLRAEQDDTHKH